MLLASVREGIRDEFLVGVEDATTGEGSWETFVDRPCWSSPEHEATYIVQLQDGRKVLVDSIDLEFRKED